MIKLNKKQKSRLLKMINKFAQNTTEQKRWAKINWLELCTTVLFERIVGYNAGKMQYMMYPFMLKNHNPIDYLYTQFKAKSF